jgi:hypothetical protein
MDRVNQYREIVEKVVHDYATFGKDPPGMTTSPIIDRERDKYVVQMVGWNKNRYVLGAMIQLDLIDGKIWIQHNGTDMLLADELESAGVPKSDIVLGFIPPERRHLTGYATG